jgi:hypothetical protein
MKTAVLSMALAGALALAAPAVRAHGGHDHVMGTVKAVDLKAGTMEVETREGKRVTVQVDDKTKYLRGPAAAKAADVVPGMRVVIDTKAADGTVVAKEVRLGAAPQAP